MLVHERLIVACIELLFLAVWPDGSIICLMFGHLDQWKFAK